MNMTSNVVGNFVGSRLVFINGGWWQPKRLGSFFMASYGKKLIAQTGIGAVMSYLITLVETHFNERRRK